MNGNRRRNEPDLRSLLNRCPQAWAQVRGSDQYPDLFGTVRFYQQQNGVLCVAEIRGLPMESDACSSPIFAFHIHEGVSCTGNEKDPFANARSHYNPARCPHPYHAGDLPPLFGVNGYAFSAFLTDRFSAEEIIGRTVIIHAGMDDFKTQPSGNAGEKIACGEIEA